MADTPCLWKSISRTKSLLLTPRRAERKAVAIATPLAAYFPSSSCSRTVSSRPGVGGEGLISAQQLHSANLLPGLVARVRW